MASALKRNAAAIVLLSSIVVLLLVSFLSRSCKREGFSGSSGILVSVGSDGGTPDEAQTGAAKGTPVAEAQVCQSTEGRCLPGEEDTGKECISRGCPWGMERGEGAKKDRCYPKCAEGWDADGGETCRRTCPKYFEQRGSECVLPPHTFNKDAVPCLGCQGPPPVIGGAVYPVPLPVRPVMMTPGTSTSVTCSTWFAPSPETFVSPTTEENPAMEKIVRLKLNEPRIDDPGQPCPRGYSLSGVMCYENCPPEYKDGEGQTCVRAGQSVPRESYNRGKGIPFIRVRSRNAGN